MTALLSIEGVSKSYGALKVTDNVSMSVAEGETLGILGPNGAGKTTLFNVISGTSGPTRGACCSALRTSPNPRRIGAAGPVSVDLIKCLSPMGR
ncbi:ATP-binding cassette domain-containing protein [Pseudoduganella sp. UC29_106]|uniref:ATP-binding cassette domain-containing protein n=1 Tax=Pseudoduganella sp. UC29_106 TaxID=3374553 RepID=UPI003757BCE5